MATLVRRRPATPQATFDRVAPRYDLLNACLSLGLDHRWRRRAALRLDLAPGAHVLDLATGTASLALAVAAQAPPGAKIVGGDRNGAMLRVGRARIRRARPGREIHLLQCVAERIPFADACFDGATMAFAVDDLDDQRLAMAETYRVLKPGAPLVLLELSLPDRPLFRAGYGLYLRLLPLVDRLFSRGGGGYAHLREEILGYRGRLAVQDLLARAGFSEYRREEMTGGIATLHLARRPRLARGSAGGV
jgi:demethylmenaquinone methyltransferase/2-methoxy-6-polyprenyl-1,4-benzoquinol methylase